MNDHEIVDQIGFQPNSYLADRHLSEENLQLDSFFLIQLWSLFDNIKIIRSLYQSINFFEKYSENTLHLLS